VQQCTRRSNGSSSTCRPWQQRLVLRVPLCAAAAAPGAAAAAAAAVAAVASFRGVIHTKDYVADVISNYQAGHN
jgi:hypothetical protein